MDEGNITATLLVTGGAIAFAILVLMWTARLTTGVGTARTKWRERAGHLEDRVDLYEALLAARPGAVMVWEESAPDQPDGWGEPRIFGSSFALADLLHFADAAEGPSPAPRILEGLADYEARDTVTREDTTLRRKLERLRTEGEAFAITIIGPRGRFMEAIGRPAGRRALLWIEDSTLRGLDESAARGRLAEARLALAEDPDAFLDMLRKAPFPAWRMSSGMKLQWANEAYQHAVEAPDLASAIAGNVLLDKDVADQARQALSGGSLVEATRPVIAGGERRNMSMSLFPISGGVAGIAIDVSKAQEAREALERHVRSQADALNHLKDAVAIFSPQRELVFYNRAFMELFGLEEKWLDTRPTHGALLDWLRERRLLPAQSDYQTWRARELALYDQINTGPDEQVWSLPDDRTLRVARLRHPDGGLLLIFGDLTDHVTLEGRFKSLTKTQQSTLNNLPVGVVVFGPDGRLRLVNDCFLQQWDVPAAKLEPGTPFDVMIQACLPKYHHREKWEDFKARVTDTNPKVRQHTEGEIERADDRLFTYALWPLPDGATALSFTDITDSRALELAMQETIAAQKEADRVKSDFVNHVSYQLRAPLQTILGYSEFLEMTAGEALEGPAAGHLQAIRTAGEQLNKLIDDILDIAAIEAETLAISPGTLDPCEAVEAAVELAQSTVDQSKVRLQVDCAPDIGTIEGDEKRFKQIVYNLVLNAMSHLDKEDAEVAVSVSRDEETLQISVQDNGAGISEEDMGRIFDRFQAGERGGAGLGLTIVNALVELHGGWVDLWSELGTGTRVTCYFPVTRTEPEGDDPFQSLIANKMDSRRAAQGQNKPA